MVTAYRIDHLAHTLVDSGELNGYPFGIWEITEDEERWDTSCNFYWVYRDENVEFGFNDSIESIRKWLEVISQVRTYTPQEIYDSPVWMEETGSSVDDFLQSIDIYTTDELREQTRIVIKSHGEGYGDVLRIQSVWLDGSPIVVWVRNGDDEDLFITDEEGFIEMRAYVQRYVGFSYFNRVSSDSSCVRRLGDYYIQEVLDLSE